MSDELNLNNALEYGRTTLLTQYICHVRMTDSIQELLLTIYGHRDNLLNSELLITYLPSKMLRHTIKHFICKRCIKVTWYIHSNRKSRKEYLFVWSIFLIWSSYKSYKSGQNLFLELSCTYYVVYVHSTFSVSIGEQVEPVFKFKLSCFWTKTAGLIVQVIVSARTVSWLDK